jgi:hypothetical protein
VSHVPFFKVQEFNDASRRAGEIAPLLQESEDAAAASAHALPAAHRIRMCSTKTDAAAKKISHHRRKAENSILPVPCPSLPIPFHVLSIGCFALASPFIANRLPSFYPRFGKSLSQKKSGVPVRKAARGVVCCISRHFSCGSAQQ